MSDRRTIDEITLPELEQILVTRKREERMRRLRARGIERELPETPVMKVSEERLTELPDLSRRAASRATRQQGKAPPSWRSRLLTLVEILALGGFVVAAILWWRETQATNLEPVAPIVIDEVVEAGSATAPEILPGNPTPPSDGGAIPPQYEAWIQPEERVNSVPITDLSEQRPTRIVIPRINVDAPIVPGVDWEALKQGVGHYPGTTYPGQRGNMVLSAHNDIFGEIFRYLEQLEVGDTFTVYDANQTGYEYVVRTRRIVEPTEVSVLANSPEPIVTLITCHPYLIDSERLVLQAELVR